MQETYDHIARIQNKLQQLLRQFSGLQKENEKLQLEVNLLKGKELLQQQQLTDLQQQVTLLKAAKVGMSEEDRASFEKRINQYLKEIDKCIAQLNNE